jgi:uncharacterized paraquat-inducible protein A
MEGSEAQRVALITRAAAIMIVGFAAFTFGRFLVLKMLAAKLLAARRAGWSKPRARNGERCARGSERYPGQ